MNKNKCPYYNEDCPKCNPMPNQNNQVEEKDWKEKLNTILWENMDLGSTNPERPMRASLQTDLVDFIEQTIHQETEKAVEKRNEELKVKVCIMREPMPSANDHKEYIRGMREGVELIRNAVISILQPTNNTKEE